MKYPPHPKSVDFWVSTVEVELTQYHYRPILCAAIENKLL